MFTFHAVESAREHVDSVSYKRALNVNTLVSLFLEGRTSMDFRPLNDTERRQLITALRGNAEHERSILMDRRDTSFVGAVDEVTDEEVISAIKSVPCHY